MKKPVVVLVGRPNVGKSTLFNRLVGERLAITDEVPGTTRDRLVSESDWAGRDFFVVDTGGLDPTQQRSQGPLSIGSAEFMTEIRTQTELAMQEADVILFLVDAQQGVTEADRELAQQLRRRQTIKGGQPYPPLVLVANKADSAASRLNALDFYSLGLGEPYPISSIHGTGTGDMLDAVVANFPPLPLEEEEDNSIKVAIVGKQNAGKSSLLNKLVGQERSIVSPIPGTTRDAIDTPIEFEGKPITLIDTAGIRKRGAIEPGVEKYSVLRSLQAIERCDVALLVVDVAAGITAQDTHIAGYILDEMKSVILVANKWDLVEKDETTMVTYEERIRQELNFLPYVPVVFTSASSCKRVNQLLPLVLRVYDERHVHLPTSQLNRILQNAQDLHQPPSSSGKLFRIYYGTQVRADPPTFMLYCNDPRLAHFTYLRFIENQIRKEYPFVGTPIKLVLKQRKREQEK